MTTEPNVMRDGASWSEEWRSALGSQWRLQLWVIAALLFATGFSLPLADPDLPMHLATGEWIARHHAVPFTEPFAWTRPGAPFFAYSWLVELIYYILMVQVGPLGLSALQGVLYLGLGAAVLALGRVAGWSPWVIILVAVSNLMVALGATPYLRPQCILLIVLPLCWALVYRSREAPRLAPILVSLGCLSAIAANTHLLFPLTLAPCVALLEDPPVDRKRLIAVPVAICAGWLLSPYAFALVPMFKLYFAKNAVLGPPSGIAEYKPGFQVLMTAGTDPVLIAALLTVAPWFVVPRLNVKARLVYGVLWLAGLVLFALAVRSLIVWWVVSLPLVAMLFSFLPAPSLPVVRTAQRAIVLAIFASVAAAGLETWLNPGLLAGNATHRFLPSLTAKATEPLFRWLECNTRDSLRGRLVTTFNYGGYVPWRLPRLSESIDGRTFFPDSVARPEAYFTPSSRDFPLPPWRTADLAILPATTPAASILDTAAGWRRIAITNQVTGPSAMIGLWVTNRWWAEAGTRPLPHSLLPVMQSVEPRTAQCAQLVAGSGN